MTDAQAIEAAVRGDRDAFSVLVQRYQRLVEGVAFGVTRNHALVDDVVQDTFVTAWRTLERLRDPSCIRQWLTAITRNLARNARRRGGRETATSDAARDIASEHTPFDQLSEQQRDDQISAALASLPARYREPIVLFYYEHCTVKEVADALALQEPAVMQRLSRGRRRLGEALAMRIEVTLESRKSRAALAACVLALLPTRSAAAAPLVATSASTATNVVATAWWRSVLVRLAAYWRMAAGLAAVTAAALILLAAVERSNAIAARSQPAAAVPAQEPAAKPASTPRLPDDATSDHIYRNIAIADLDPAITCARGASGLVLGALGKDALVVRGDQRYYEPTPELQQTIDRVSSAAAAACGGDRWPEVYVICEGTVFDILDGNVSCYPYAIFDEPLAVDHPIFRVAPPST